MYLCLKHCFYKNCRLLHLTAHHTVEFTTIVHDARKNKNTVWSLTTELLNTYKFAKSFKKMLFRISKMAVNK